MAIKILNTSSTLSGSAGLYERVEANNIASFAGMISAGTYWITATAGRTISVTFATAGNQLGMMLYLRNGTAGTLTIVLKEGTTTRTTDTFNLAASPLPDVGAGWHYFPLTSYAVTTAASTWSYLITWTSATGYLYVNTTSGTDIAYMVSLDADSTIIASGTDTLVLKDNVVLTFDQSFTFAATGIVSIIFAMDSTLQWENPPVASYTLTTNARWWNSSSDNLYIGSSALPIPAAQMAIIDASAITYGLALYNAGTNLTYAGIARHKFELYGAEDTKIATRIAANAAAAQNKIITTVDMSADWVVGDTLSIIGKQVAAQDIVSYTISAISGTEITLSANLDYAVLAGGAVINYSRNANCGIKIKGVATSMTYFTVGIGRDYFQAAGVYFERMGLEFGGAAEGVYSTNTTKDDLIRNCLFYKSAYTAMNIVSIKSTRITVDGIYFHNTGAQSYPGLIIVANNSTISNVFSKNYYGNYLGSYGLSGATFPGGLYIKGTSNTLSGIVCAHGRVLDTYGYYVAYFIGSGITANDIFVYGGGEYAAAFNCKASTFTDVVINGGDQANYWLIDNVDLKFVNAKVGVDVAATTQEIYCESDSIQKAIFDNAEIGSATTIVTNIGNCGGNSYVRFHTYDLTANQHQGWEQYGNYSAAGDGLGDTTVHTAGTGKFGIRFEPTSSTNNHIWTFYTPTGNIQNQTMTVAVWVKINNAAYYAGTHQNPRLTVNYDNGTETYTQATDSTDWQLLSVTFTPTTTYGQITVTLSGRTDAVNSNAYVYFDDFAVLYPAGYRLDLGGMDLWANALPITPPIATVLSAKDVWTASSTEDYGNNTMGKQLSKKVLTIAKFLGLK